MTTATRMPAQQAAHERKSAVLIVVITLIALLLGWGVKTAVQNNTRLVERGGVTAYVPDGWLVQDGAGDLIFLARNPQAIDQLYRVSVVPADSDLESVAAERSFARSQLEATYRVLETTPIVVGGRDGYKVSYALVDVDSPGIPHVIEGVEYYFPSGDELLVVSMEADSDSFANVFAHFQRFLTSVSYGTGG